MSVGPDLGGALLEAARGAIEVALGLPGRALDEPEAFARPGATFVTLTRAGALRGCIGSLEAYRALGEDVRANARAAALRDPRFPAMAGRELASVRVEVSLLSVPEPLEVRDERDLARRLEPGVDGVILSLGPRRGTFLPQVWEALPEPEDFLRELKRKAGIPEGYWSESIEVARYRVTQWKEPGRAREART